MGSKRTTASESTTLWDRSAVYNISFAVLILVLLAVLLIYNGMVRYEQSRQFELTNVSTSAKGAATEVAKFIAERQRLVSVFVNDHLDSFAAYSLKPITEMRTI